MWLRDATVSLDNSTGTVTLLHSDGSEKRYTTRPAGIGRSIQDMYVAGGMESWVQQRL